MHLRDESAGGKNDTQQKILDALREKSPQKVSDLKKVAGIKSIDNVLRDLEAEGYVERASILSSPSVSPKTVRTVMPSVPEDEVIDALAKLKKSRATKQMKVFSYIAKYDYPLDVKTVYDAVDASSADLNVLERKGLVQIGKRIVYRDSLEDRDFLPSKAPDLTPGQDAVWQVIRKSLNPGLERQVGEQDASQDNVEADDTQVAEKVPSPTHWGGDLGEGVKLPFQQWASVYAPPELYSKLKKTCA